MHPCEGVLCLRRVDCISTLRGPKGGPRKGHYRFPRTRAMLFSVFATNCGEAYSSTNDYSPFTGKDNYTRQYFFQD